MISCGGGVLCLTDEQRRRAVSNPIVFSMYARKLKSATASQPTGAPFARGLEPDLDLDHP